MRVIKPLLNRLHRCEDGASVVIVSLMLVLLFGAAALAVDGGQLYVARRAMVTSTDSAALAEAGALALQEGASSVAPTNCTGEGDPLFTTNGGENGACSIKYSGIYPYVEYEGTRTVDFTFAPVMGVTASDVYSSTAAAWGPPTAVQGLRPIAMCIHPDDDPSTNDPGTHIAEWLASRGTPAYDALYGTDPTGDALGDPTSHLYDHPPFDDASGYFEDEGGDVVHRIVRGSTAANCGSGGPALWDYVDFNGEPVGGELVDWLLGGYSGLVGVDDCDFDSEASEDCLRDPGTLAGSPGSCPSDPRNVAQALSCLDENDVQFTVLLYDEVTCDVHGRCFYNPAGFLGVELVGFNFTGDQKDRYIDLEFHSMTLTGVCCDRSGPDTGLRVTFICDVNDVGSTDPISDAERCDTSG